MKKKLKTLAALTLIFALLALSGASCDKKPSNPPVKVIKVGMTLYDGYDTFIGLLSEQFAELAREKEQAEGVNITIMLEHAEKNQLSQNNQVERFIERGCDVICVNLVNRDDTSVIIDKADAAGIPVIFFNRELVGEDLERGDRLFYVGAPTTQAGALQGEIVAEYCRENMETVDKNSDGVLQYVMLKGEFLHQDDIQRARYSVETLENAGFKTEKLDDDYANWMRSQGEALMTQWIDKNDGGIEIIFSNNDEMALGAIEALRKADMPQAEWPVIVGVDGVPEGIAAVEEGLMTGTVLNDAKGQAEALMKLVWACATGTLAEVSELAAGKYIRVPYKKITRENASEFTGYYN